MACFDPLDHREILKIALNHISRVVEIEQRDPGNWRGRAALAAVHLFCGLLPSARANFALAIKLNAAATQKYGWYWAFLITDGQISKAIELISQHCLEAPTNAMIRAALALALYLSRDYASALKHAEESVILSHTCWFGHLVCALIHHERNEEEPAVISYLTMKQSLGIPGPECFSGLFLLLAQSDAIRDKIKAGYKEYLLRVITPRDEDGKYDYLNMAVAFTKMNPSFSAKAFSLCMGETSYPPFLWASLWPFFDPIREEPEFASMVATINRGLQ